ncbi:MAG TPA: Na+/H+ antiporter NhaA [Bacteroidales bacterium]|nr:Na+/H+ antiporter NhaA [Bacteroidales bacterium]
MQERIKSLFDEFFESEKSSGIILIFATIVSLLLANSALGANYLKLWDTEVGIKIGSFELYKSLGYWINEGLMAFFFLLVGLEIERELYVGELSTKEKAFLPVLAAIGGMAVPALLYYSFNKGTATASGIGIPMATDIAFALGILSLLGNRVPFSLKIFLAALAIIDDLGAIIIIAVFYVHDFSLTHLLIALGIYAVMISCNRFRVKNIPVYLVLGGIMWYFMLKSGVHATITGVLTAFAIPFNRGDERSPSTRLQHALHKPVTFWVMPLFALANTGILLSSDILKSAFDPNVLGIFFGLVLGKPLGILLFTWLGMKLWGVKLPADIRFSQIIGMGFLAGIGFTMSMFITLLAFSDQNYVVTSKTIILGASIVAGTIGYIILRKKRV